MQVRFLALPNYPATPAQLEITGADGAFMPARFTGTIARLAVIGKTATFATGSVTSSVTLETLDRIQRSDVLVEGSAASLRFQLIWQRHCEAIEAAFAELAQRVTDTEALLLQIQAAQTLAQAASNTAAATASAASLADSRTDPANVLTASSAGTVTIAAHSRVYGNGDRVPVDAGSVSGLPSGTFQRIYYQDSAREGGNVAYHSTPDNVAQEGATHVLGGVSIPEVGQPPSSGTGTAAPGNPSNPDGVYDGKYNNEGL